MVENKDLVKLLKTSFPDSAFINKVKFIYRPYICPFSRILAQIQPDSKVMDIGCGNGAFLFMIAKLCNPKSVSGLEVNQELVDAATALLSSTEIPSSVNIYDGVKLPSDLDSFKYITMIDVLHHIPSKIQEGMLTQIHKLMSIGSVLLLKDIDKSNPLVFANKIHDLILSGKVGAEWRLTRAIDFLTNIGFEIELVEKERMLWYPHYWIQAKKV